MLMSLVITSFIISMVFFIITHSIGKKLLLDREMNSPFECGFSTKEESRFPFSLRFFLIALIFLIFDVELLLLFPYLSSLLYSSSFISLMVYFSFLSLLSVGLYYEWNNMMLEWTK